jgi:hypothetical protein
VADIDAFVRAEADALVAELSAWCAIPSISTIPGTPPTCAARPSTWRA